MCIMVKKAWESAVKVVSEAVNGDTLASVGERFKFPALRSICMSTFVACIVFIC